MLFGRFFFLFLLHIRFLIVINLKLWEALFEKLRLEMVWVKVRLFLRHGHRRRRVTQLINVFIFSHEFILFLGCNNILLLLFFLLFLFLLFLFKLGFILIFIFLLLHILNISNLFLKDLLYVLLYLKSKELSQSGIEPMLKAKLLGKRVRIVSFINRNIFHLPSSQIYCYSK